MFPLLVHPSHAACIVDIGCSFEVAAGEQNKTACGPCDKGSRSVAVANGCVCYSGIVPGSKAYYACDGGYGSGSRECLRDGKWSGAPLVCGNSSTVIQASGGICMHECTRAHA